MKRREKHVHLLANGDCVDVDGKTEDCESKWCQTTSLRLNGLKLMRGPKMHEDHSVTVVRVDKTDDHGWDVVCSCGYKYALFADGYFANSYRNAILRALIDYAGGGMNAQADAIMRIITHGKA